MAFTQPMKRLRWYPASMIIQHTKWLEEGRASLAWRTPVPSLNVLLTSTCWRNDHNGFSHQGPGLIDVILSKQGKSPASICHPTRTACSRWPITACGAAAM